MSIDGLGDEDIVAILKGVRTIAMVGASASPDRPSNGVMAFLQSRGYVVHPINPGFAGREIHGAMVFARLADVPAPVDMVDIFRASSAVPGIVEDVIAQKDRLGIKVVWTQLGVVNEDAAQTARAAGLKVVMDRCPKIEIGRLARG